MLSRASKEKKSSTTKNNIDKKPTVSRKYVKNTPKVKLFDKEILKRFLIALFIFLLVSGLFFAYQVYEKNIKFDEKLKSIVKRLDEDSCKVFKQNLVNTFLEIQVDNSEQVVNSTIYLFSNSVRYSINVNNYKFSIDNLGNQGTLKDLIKTNSIFLDKKSVFKYLSTFFYRNFYIKLDLVVIKNNENALDSYFSARSLTPLERYFSGEVDTTYSLYTDLCFDDFNRLLSFFYSIPLATRTFEYTTNTSVKSLFGLDDIKKEQIRIQILNASGVEQWGFFMERLFENYGLNVVKLDNSGSVVNKTTISVDSNDIKDSATLNMLNYLLINPVVKNEIKNQENIFSDVYIVIGQDSIN